MLSVLSTTSSPTMAGVAFGSAAVGGGFAFAAAAYQTSAGFAARHETTGVSRILTIPKAGLPWTLRMRHESTYIQMQAAVPAPTASLSSFAVLFGNVLYTLCGSAASAPGGSLCGGTSAALDRAINGGPGGGIQSERRGRKAGGMLRALGTR
ncbi:hypothetical protein HYPSUDRAFT_208862 [Hypholoma sublateritium FD-334 SS-4]|uniref:Uncharacterized protein n=1 Tax=Hypholoma sublateritium (strain FD-334 SS-4) TaxID=945553 RepID=A0A0D2NCH8_HYPSF|nr:hypothetical protein HYPSUDRAFT_208862 [Hypholoma sublateritium FD-334 SS-4]